jgi:hypothetical protein
MTSRRITSDAMLAPSSIAADMAAGTADEPTEELEVTPLLQFAPLKKSDGARGRSSGLGDGGAAVRTRGWRRYVPARLGNGSGGAARNAAERFAAAHRESLLATRVRGMSAVATVLIVQGLVLVCAPRSGA